MQQRNVLQYLEQTVTRVPDKIAFGSPKSEITFKDVYHHARAIGSKLYADGLYKQPVVVFMEKSPEAIVSFFGVVYGGNYYVPIDEEMPVHRIELIFQTLNPQAIICDGVTREMVSKFNYQGKLYMYEELVQSEICEEDLASIRDRQIDTDPMYIVFTSGSTGIPKGVMACHRSVLDYIENLSEVLEFNEDTVFGNQTPLYFDACLKELYPTLKFGATTYLIPKELFMFPIKLIEFLNAHKINTVCWVVSALTMISAFGALDEVKPEYLHTVAFGSEVFPIKQFNRWREALPDCRFTNLYGPTEGTGMCCYYKVDREFALDEAIPIGGPFKNTEILLLGEDNQPVPAGEQGEICIRGTSVTLGYYRNPEKTGESYVQNPLNDMYPEIIYKTGDLAKYNERGELIYLSRKDYQIKHMGHRIELGEIEVVVNMLDGMKNACCIFDDEKKKIILCYVGDMGKADVTKFLKEKLPRYMIPNKIYQLEAMPLTANGKLDRVTLKNTYVKKA